MDKHTAYIAAGLASAAVAVYLLPVIFGPAAVYCGVRLYQTDDRPTGAAVALAGGLGLLVGSLNAAITGFPGLEVGGLR